MSVTSATHLTSTISTLQHSSSASRRVRACITAESVTCIHVDIAATVYYCSFATCCEKCKVLKNTSCQQMSLKTAKFRLWSMIDTTQSEPQIIMWGRYFEQKSLRLVGYIFWCDAARKTIIILSNLIVKLSRKSLLSFRLKCWNFFCKT